MRNTQELRHVFHLIGAGIGAMWGRGTARLGMCAARLYNWCNKNERKYLVGSSWMVYSKGIRSLATKKRGCRF